MADVVNHQSWTLRLTTEEFRLVMKALGGRLSGDDEIHAKELGDQLSIIRAKLGQQANEVNQKLINSLRAAKAWPEEEES